MTDHKPPSPTGQLLLLTLAGAALLLPFIGKPFHIDDPLFVWAGQHIRQDPFDPYGFRVNWYTTETTMARETQNPPLACYYIAAVGAVAGWSEPALHLAFLVPALAMLWGTFRLAELLGSRPLLVGLLTLASPVVLVSATSVMCDTMMLAFWVWSVVFWLRGVRAGRAGLVFLGAALATLASLTKYYGVSLVPLLGAYALARRASWRLWLPALALVALTLAGYEVLMRRLYGHGHLSQALGFVSYMAEHQGRRVTLSSFLNGLSMTGSCVAMALFAAPWLAPRRSLLLLGALALLLIPVCALLWRFPAAEYEGLIVVQAALWVAVGFGILTLALADLRQRRDPEALLLVLWVLGTFVFASFVNWTNNARSILPLAPAVAILIGRRLDRRFGPAGAAPLRPLTPALVPAFLLVLLVGYADSRQAVAARQAAEHYADVARRHSGTFWFHGHWGLQFYLQQHGAKPWDYAASQAEAGDLFLFASNNYPNLPELPPGSFRAVETFEVTMPWLAVHNFAAGAGFYSSMSGPLAFAVYPLPAERYMLYEVTKSVVLPTP